MVQGFAILAVAEGLMGNPFDIADRVNKRVAYTEGRLMVRCGRSGPLLPGSLMDIRMGGCRLWMEEPLHVSASQVIEVRLDLNSVAFRVLGFVRHVSPADHCLGVQFHQLSEKDSFDLKWFIQFFGGAEEDEA